MIDKYNGEQVLVFDSKIMKDFFGPVIVGVNNVKSCLDAIKRRGNIRFELRCIAEEDETMKQVIPYVVLRDKSNVFSYLRGASSGEDRLKRLRSIGVGGHINMCDVNLEDINLFDAISDGAVRELKEEVSGFGRELEYIGLINDDSNDVGKVHLGVVMENKLHGINPLSVESAVKCTSFMNVLITEKTDLEYDSLEPWSKFAFDMIKRRRIHEVEDCDGC